PSASLLVLSLLAQLLHYRKNQFLGSVQRRKYTLKVHRRLTGIPIAGAVHTVLANQDEGIGEKVHGHGKAAANGAHHELMLLDFFFVIVEDGHRSISPRTRRKPTPGYLPKQPIAFPLIPPSASARLPPSALVSSAGSVCALLWFHPCALRGCCVGR